MRRSACLLVSTTLAVACGDTPPQTLPPLGHVVLYVDTDAPVPSAPGTQPDPAAPPPLFDRVRIDVYQPGDAEPCTGCSRDFAIDEAILRHGASITIEPTSDRKGLVARARLYLSASVVDGYLRPESTVDAFVALPSVPKEGAVPVGVLLPTDSLGAPIGARDAPVAATKGKPESRVGTWPGASRVDCAGAPGPGEVCVPGGAYWMGNAVVHGPAEPSDHRRLVVLSPFFLSAHEVTVAELRTAPVAGTGHVEKWSGTTDGNDFHDWCSFTAQPDPDREGLPVTCITWFGAQMYCQDKGGDLPTEAELEYAAGGLRSSDYVWGHDSPSCSDAVWGRSGVGILKTFTEDCRPSGTSGGPLALDPSGSGRDLDRLVLPTGTVFDLAGNVSEWARDFFQGQDEACWAPRSDGNVFRDPLCETEGSLGSLRSVRGGEWIDNRVVLRAATRTRRDPTFLFAEVGFRCARAAAPPAN